MAEFEVGGRLYRSKRLNAYDQFVLFHRLQPIMPALQSIDIGLQVAGLDVRTVLEILSPLARSSDEDVLHVFQASLDAAEVYGDEGWAPVANKPGLIDLMRIVGVVVVENFGQFFAMKRVRFRPTLSDLPSYKTVEMPDGEGWLFRPVLRGMIKGESLYDGTLRIEHIAKLNDAIDVSDENEARARKAAEKR